MSNPDIVPKEIIIEATSLVADVSTRSGSFDGEAMTPIEVSNRPTPTLSAKVVGTRSGSFDGEAMTPIEVSNRPTPTLSAKVVEPLYSINIQGYGPFSDKRRFLNDVIKQLGDTLSTSEVLSTSLTSSRALDDALSVLESIARSAGLRPSDAIAITEFVFFASNFVLAESTAAIETLSKSLSRTATENTAILDTDFIYDLGNFQTLLELLGLSETLIKSCVKTLLDSVNTTETLSRASSKALSDNLSTVETQFKTPLKSVFDNTSLSETALLQYVNYVGPSYVNPDYVGSSYSL